jgi:transketolase
MDAPMTMLANAPTLEDRARRIRRNALRMGEVQGQGYIAQALGVADVLAVSYFHALTYRPEDPYWEGRDRFLLSIGHYAIALYSVLIEAGIVPEEELETYGTDDSRLPMSGMASYTPGMEISGGSLGIGLGIAVGMGLGLKRKSSKSFVYNLMSDGELNEGPTWEAAMSAAHWKLDNLICLVDVNQMQADGPSTGVLNFEPLPAKWEAFGWHAQRVNGNDIGALVGACDTARELAEPKPRVIICDTRWRRACHFLRLATSRISCGWSRTNGRSRSKRSIRGGCHDQAGTLAWRHRSGGAVESGERLHTAAANHLRDDRFACRRRPADEPGAVRASVGRGGEEQARDRRHDGRPREVHRPAHLRDGVPRPLLPDGYGRAAPDARGRRHGP